MLGVVNSHENAITYAAVVTLNVSIWVQKNKVNDDD